MFCLVGVFVILMLIFVFDWLFYGFYFVVFDVVFVRLRLMVVVLRIFWVFVSGFEMDSGVVEVVGCDCLCFWFGSEKGNLDEWFIVYWVWFGVDVEFDLVGF